MEFGGKRARGESSNLGGNMDENPYEQGMNFPVLTQNVLYSNLIQRTKGAQKFADIQTLKDLNVYKGVKALLRNIGWEKLLTLHAKSYQTPMLEFLATLRMEPTSGVITFRLLNQSHHMNVDDLCDIINAPKGNNTYAAKGKINREFDRDCPHFWSRISCDDADYHASHAKASSIIHPVLKATHRIIASLIFPQEEISKAGKKELELLWCMIYKPAKGPHFGLWLLNKMMKLTYSNGGQLHCGGMITIIAEHIGVHLPDNPLDTIPGRTLLSMDVLEFMHLFHRQNNRDIHWNVDGKEYLRIDGRNKKNLDLARTITSTNWKPSSNLGISLSQSAPPPRAPPPTGSSSSSQHIPFPEHNIYMGEFARQNARYESLHEEVGEIYTGVAENTSEFHDYRTLQDQRWEQQQQRWTEDDRRWTAQEQHNRNVHYLMSDLHRALVLPPQPQPPPQQPQWPPYYPSDYNPYYPSQYPPQYPPDHPPPGPF